MKRVPIFCIKQSCNRIIGYDFDRVRLEVGGIHIWGDSRAAIISCKCGKSISWYPEEMAGNRKPRKPKNLGLNDGSLEIKE